MEARLKQNRVKKSSTFIETRRSRKAERAQNRAWRTPRDALARQRSVEAWEKGVEEREMGNDGTAAVVEVMEGTREWRGNDGEEAAEKKQQRSSKKLKNRSLRTRERETEGGL